MDEPNSLSNDEAALVAALQRGDERAFQTLVEQLGARVYRLVNGVLGSPENAEDVVQEVFMKVYTGISTFRGQSGLATWVHRVAINTALTQRKRFARRHETALEGDYEDVRHAPVEARIEEQSRHRLLATVIEQLPPQQRTVFQLRVIEGLPLDEVAELLSLSVGTVKATQFAAVRKVQVLVSAHRGLQSTAISSAVSEGRHA